MEILAEKNCWVEITRISLIIYLQSACLICVKIKLNTTSACMYMNLV